MSQKTKPETQTQVAKWLQKLERESWQLELLVSAFTIFLLIQAVGDYDHFYGLLPYQFNFNQSVILFFYLFLGLIGLSLKALTLFLIVHLLLRGFWIGAIGLRSVQSQIDFQGMNFSPYFTERLEKRVVSLDRLVVKLDDICSVIFSFSFLIISSLISFGLYMIFLGVVTLGAATLGKMTTGWLTSAFAFVSAITFFAVLISGLIYMIDFFSLGFFKKYRWISKVYGPIYRFYGVITIATITRSIYYYLISKFSKRRIRVLYLIILAIMVADWLIEFDQYQYYSEEAALTIHNNYYDDLRNEDSPIVKASVPSTVIRGPFLKLFLRYDPKDNEDIRAKCPDFEPLKNDGLNPAMELVKEGNNYNIRSRGEETEDHEKLLECLSSIYEVSIGDSIYQDLKYYFYRHPDHDQKGLMTMIPTSGFSEGEVLIVIRKYYSQSEDDDPVAEFASIPLWIAK